MKINTDFEDVSLEVYNRQQRAKAWDRKKHYAPDDMRSWFERITMLFACLTFSMAVICLGVIYYEHIVKFVNDIPVWGWFLFSLVSVAVLLCWGISYLANKAAENEECYYEDKF